uniref:lipopolysaccharide biosynthesis protein n=2 Tax=Roseivirga sp. TaxID=1964215 RepID=UPI0040474B7A
MTILRKKVKSGLIWTATELIVTRGTKLVTAIVLTRLLLPSEFGLVALIMIFIAVGNAFADGGLGNSIINDQESSELDFSTVFYINLLTSVLIYVTLFLSSSVIASYFEEPALTYILRVYGLTIILTAFTLVHKSILIKNMAFRELTLLSLPGVFIGSIIAIILAYNDYGIWSLIFLEISTQILISTLIWIKSSWTPAWTFSFKRAKHHWRYGYKLMISSIMHGLFTEIYSIIIGKRFSISSLGYYNRARAYNVYGVNLVSDIISKVSFPLLSSMKEDVEKVAITYRSILKSVFFIVTPIMFTLGVVAEPLFLFLFSEKWLGSVKYFQILTLSSILIPIHSFNINIFKVLGRTDLFLKIEIIKTVLMAGVILIGLFYGLDELIWAIVASSYISLFINSYYSKQLIGYKTFTQLRDMSPTFIISILSASFGYLISNLLEQSTEFLQIICVSITTLTTYTFINFMLKPSSYKEFKLNVKLIFLK